MTWRMPHASAPRGHDPIGYVHHLAGNSLSEKGVRVGFALFQSSQKESEPFRVRFFGAKSFKQFEQLLFTDKVDGGGNEGAARFVSDSG